MSAYKNEVIIIGTGSINSNNTSCQQFSSNVAITTWIGSVSYGIGNCVEYSSVIYRSLINSNMGNEPDLNPTYWETVLTSTKDGDIAFIINGGSSDINIRQNNVWVSITIQPSTVALVDGQVSPAPALSYPANVFPYAMIEYTVRRGAGTGRAQEGVIYVQTDQSLITNYRHQFSHIGNAVNVTFSVSISGGVVYLNYTSVNEGVPIQFKYIVKGWS